MSEAMFGDPLKFSVLSLNTDSGLNVPSRTMPGFIPDFHCEAKHRSDMDVPQKTVTIPHTAAVWPRLSLGERVR